MAYAVKHLLTLLALAREHVRRLRSRPRLGLYLCPTGSSVVEVDRNGRVLWESAWEEQLGAAMTPERAAELLSRAREATRSWFKPVLVIGLHPAFAQFKRLWRFPRTQDEYVDSMVVRENATQFFRTFPSGIVTSDAVRDDAGFVWAAAFDGTQMRALYAAAASRGLTLRGVVPQESLPTKHVHPVNLATPLGIAAWRSAMQGWSREQMRFAASLNPRRPSRPGSVRRRLAAGALAAALIVAGAWPILTARHLMTQAQRARDELRTKERVAREVEAELAGVGRRLSRLATSGAPQLRGLDLLEHLTSALPSGSVVTRVSLDSSGGRVEILSPAEDDFAARLAQSPLVKNPELVGPVAIDRASGRELFRYSLRFAHGSSTAAGRSP